MGERTHWCIMPISGQWVIAAMVVPTGLCQKMLNIWRGANKIYIRRCIIGDIISMSTRLKNGRFTKRKKRDVVSENVKSVGIEWCDGRRIINLKLLANRLMECSNNLCKKPLTLCNISSESNVGVASILFITCECGHMNRVPTDTTHPTNKYDKYDINTKLSEAIVDCGLTFSSVQKFFAILGIPYPSVGLL